MHFPRTALTITCLLELLAVVVEAAAPSGSYMTNAARIQAGLPLNSPNHWVKKRVGNSFRMLPGTKTKARRAVPSGVTAASGTLGVISVTVGSSTSYLGPASTNGQYTLTPNIAQAIQVDLPSVCPSSTFKIGSPLGFVGASVDADQVLVNGATPGKRAEGRGGRYAQVLDRYERRMTATAIAAAQEALRLATIEQIRATEVFVYDNTIVLPALMTVNAIRATTYNTYNAIGDFTPTAVNALNAAVDTQITAAHAAAYIACVAQEAQLTTAITAAGAASPLNDPLSATAITTAATAAALAVTTAANYAAFIDTAPGGCVSTTAVILTQRTADQTAAALAALIAKIAGDQQQSTAAVTMTAASNQRLAVASNAAASGSAYALLTDVNPTTTTQTETSMWQMNLCSTKQLTIVYTNADSSVVSPTYAFIDPVTGDVGVTGSLAGYNAAYGHSVSAATLTFVPYTG